LRGRSVWMTARFRQDGTTRTDPAQRCNRGGTVTSGGKCSSRSARFRPFQQAEVLSGSLVPRVEVDSTPQLGDRLFAEPGFRQRATQVGADIGRLRQQVGGAPEVGDRVIQAIGGI